MSEDLRDLYSTLNPKARYDLRPDLIHDQADRDAVSSCLMRYRDQNGEDWADIIDFMTITRRLGERLLGCLPRLRRGSISRRSRIEGGWR